MSAARVRALGIGALWDGGLWPAIRPSEAALRRLHKFLNDISPLNLRQVSGGGLGDEADDEKVQKSPWNDPALWMLMMH